MCVRKISSSQLVRVTTDLGLGNRPERTSRHFRKPPCPIVRLTFRRASCKLGLLGVWSEKGGGEARTSPRCSRPFFVVADDAIGAAGSVDGGRRGVANTSIDSMSLVLSSAAVDDQTLSFGHRFADQGTPSIIERLVGAVSRARSADYESTSQLSVVRHACTGYLAAQGVVEQAMSLFSKQFRLIGRRRRSDFFIERSRGNLLEGDRILLRWRR